MLLNCGQGTTMEAFLPVSNAKTKSKTKIRKISWTISLKKPEKCSISSLVMMYNFLTDNLAGWNWSGDQECWGRRPRPLHCHRNRRHREYKACHDNFNPHHDCKKSRSQHNNHLPGKAKRRFDWRRKWKCVKVFFLIFKAQNSADREPKTAKIHLLVEYAPQVEIKIDHTPLFEGEAVVFTCVAHSNPPDMTYR